MENDRRLNVSSITANQSGECVMFKTLNFFILLLFLDPMVINLENSINEEDLTAEETNQQKSESSNFTSHFCCFSCYVY